jgi:hypothetical protein
VLINLLLHSGFETAVTFLWRDREKLPALAGRIPAAVHRVAKARCKSHPTNSTPHQVAKAASNNSPPKTQPQIFISHRTCHCV